MELAYLQRLLVEPVPLFALVRTSLGYILLDQDGAGAIAARLSGAEPWGAAGVGARVSARTRPQTVQRAESDLRRLAVGRCLRSGLARLLTRHVPRGAAYLNVGHSNLTERTLRAVRAGVQGQISVLLHDTIPLDHPQYQRPGMPERFAKMLRRIEMYADLVICNSAYSEERLHHHSEVTPNTVVAHLGVDPMSPKTSELPVELAQSGPYFVTVGTIEPRKRHDLLLDVWEDMADPPPLFICGARGWENAKLFQRLDALPENSQIRELPGLSDAAIAALMANATALLFPSDAEGFGLPPVEAAALGTVVLCQKLRVYQEILGDIPVYASGTDRYQWRNIIERLIRDQNQGAKAYTGQVFVPPSWENHFNIVLKVT
ncbi:MAG: glycosyltransferase [Paracoccaceae bacterium]